ncbi:CLUMA_CG011267, isoform A [Clunio marinus]|uniref:CLUMA_CG011267, isoform A n=1 Tax=Clunio marinus TaxID=568069 RepID=A0A1J1IEB0_9DIPT|nr:CLUMA_CG011267, isoform A [Clunio marinus]
MNCDASCLTEPLRPGLSHVTQFTYLSHYKEIQFQFSPKKKKLSDASTQQKKLGRTASRPLAPDIYVSVKQWQTTVSAFILTSRHLNNNRFYANYSELREVQAMRM